MEHFSGKRQKKFLNFFERFKKKEELFPFFETSSKKILLKTDKKTEEIGEEKIKELSSSLLISKLFFLNESIYKKIQKKTKKLKEKNELSKQQIWLGTFYEKEIKEAFSPPLYLKWINEEIGYGVFAHQKLKKMDFIGEYTGVVRKRERRDRKNPYCFEYLLAPGHKSCYTVDARDIGGLSRFINHSSEPNLMSALATIEGISHIILYAKREIQKDEQLFYDYGVDYWSCRKGPLSL